MTGLSAGWLLSAILVVGLIGMITARWSDLSGVIRSGIIVNTLAATLSAATMWWLAPNTPGVTVLLYAMELSGVMVALHTLLALAESVPLAVRVTLLRRAARDTRRSPSAVRAASSVCSSRSGRGSK